MSLLSPETATIIQGKPMKKVAVDGNNKRAIVRIIRGKVIEYTDENFK